MENIINLVKKENKESLIKEITLLHQKYIEIEKKITNFIYESEQIQDKFVDTYTKLIVNENADNIALCPLCDNLPLDIDYNTFAKCHNCGIKIVIMQHMENIIEYVVYFIVPELFLDGNKEETLVIEVRKEVKDGLIPPPIFSINDYNKKIRPKILDFIKRKK